MDWPYAFSRSRGTCQLGCCRAEPRPWLSFASVENFTFHGKTVVSSNAPVVVEKPGIARSICLSSVCAKAQIDGLWSARGKQQRRTEPNIEEHCGLQRFSRRKDGPNKKHGCLRTAFLYPAFQSMVPTESIDYVPCVAWLVGG